MRSASSGGLVTDFYELTMMQGYLRWGLADCPAVFELFFREIPLQGGYCVAAGLADAVEFLTELRFDEGDIAYLRWLGDFDDAFLERLRRFRFTGDVDAIPEGTPVFPLEPLLRVRAPLFEAQLVESALLNIVNFQTLIATRAARVCQEAGRDNVLEFGLRRAHGFDGAFSATRAAYVGGCVATSNVEAARHLGIPARGTQAHSWIMAFPDELTAMRRYAETFPDNCVLLVDTYDTLRSGIPHAIQVARELRARGHELKGIRLDSGDLAYLSVEARRMLDEAGFPDVKILASGDLDEWIIRDLKSQGARIDLWGVGTRLVTSHGASALTGVYKLMALLDGTHWIPRVKLAETPAKSTIPGIKQVWRLYDADGWMMADLITLETETVEPGRPVTGYHPFLDNQFKTYEGIARAEPLLVPILRGGQFVRALPPLGEIRARTLQLLDRLHPTSRRLLNPHTYKVSLSETLKDLTHRLRLGATLGPLWGGNEAGGA
jgi:nicotinate phosphoribosyltransferase